MYREREIQITFPTIRKDRFIFLEMSSVQIRCITLRLVRKLEITVTEWEWACDWAMLCPGSKQFWFRQRSVWAEPEQEYGSNIGYCASCYDAQGQGSTRKMYTCQHQVIERFGPTGQKWLTVSV